MNQTSAILRKKSPKERVQNAAPNLCSSAAEVGKADDLCLVWAGVAFKSGKKP
jgi:hypothetical protein